MNYAIILAGGSGNRAKQLMPKQFFMVREMPMIVYTLEKFQKSKLIDKICVVCLDPWMETMLHYSKKYDLDKLEYFAKGGNTGIDSLINGLEVLKETVQQDDLILIHDGVRPFISEDVILDNIRVASVRGLAMTAVKCEETLVQSSDGVYADKMISRNGIYRIQTPQTFRYSLLKDFLEEIDDTASEPSIFALWMSMGNGIYCSKGNEKNIKITYSEDIEYFSNMFVQDHYGN